MTLAPARPMPAPSDPDGADPTVTAVVVSQRDARGLGDLLTAVLGQSLTPDTVLVLDRTGGALLPGTVGTPDPELAEVVEAARSTHRVPIDVWPVDPRTPVRVAVHRALLEHELDGAPTALAWLLPVGTTPEVGALVALVDTWRRSPSTGIVGPKHVDATDPHLLRALEIRSTRGGRLLSRPAPGEPDQGQYDRMTDALAVPFAGSLVERDLVATLRGWEASFGDVGADLDLCWRAHNAGRRVVVVPTARVRSTPGVAVAVASTPARRRAARRVALARASWWAAPALALWIAVTSLLAAVGLVLLKRPRAAWAELSSLGSLDPFRGASARWRTRHRREVGRRDLRVLFAPRRAVLTGWADAVHGALVSPRPPIGDAANDLTPRSWLARLVRHPGVLAATASAGVAVIAARALGPGVVTGAGSGLAGGELVGNRADAAVLWSSWTDGWTGAGLGGPDPVGPQAALLALPAWLVDHVPLLPSPASPAGLVVALVMILGMPLAATSAYLSLSLVVRTRWVRGLAAFAWATTGVASAGVAQGRLGAVVALVLLPPIAAGLWLLATRRSTATSAFATAFASVLLGAFAPVLLAPVVVLALLLAVLRSRVRAHALVVALVPVAVLAPWLARAGEASWPVVVAGAGLAQWGGSTPEPWQLALLHTGGPGSPLVWFGVPLVAVAVLALVRGRAWGSAQTALTLLAPALLAVALVAPRVRLGTVPAGVEGTGEPITLWSGTLLLPLALVLVLALARGLDGILPATGADGVPRATGSDGVSRATGSDGVQPGRGLDGIPRASGSDGVQLSSGADGIQRASGADGVALEAGLDGIPLSSGPDDAHHAGGSDGVQPLTSPAGVPLARGADGVALGRGLDRLPRGEAPSHPRLRAAARRGTVLVAGVAVAVGAGGVAWATFGTDLAPWRDPRPAVSVEQAEGAFATRALFVSPGDRGAGYRFVGREASDVVRQLPAVAASDGSLAPRISAVLGDGSAAPELFADTATDLLAVRSGVVPEVTRRLDATEGLQRIAPRDGWEMWRVSPRAGEQALVAPPRLRLETPDGATLVTTTGQHAGTDTTVEVPPGSRLVVAEPLGWADEAVVAVDGIRVEPVAGTATPTYALPVGTTRLTVTVTDASRWWHVAQALAFVALAFLAIPFGRRESRVGRR